MIQSTVIVPRGAATFAAIAAVCFALAFSAPARAQQIQVSVSVQGKGKVPKEIKGAMCRAALDFLASSFPGTKLPSDCAKKIPDAPIHLKADGIFEVPYTVLNLLLELKNVQENAIIKQKSVTINFPAGEKPRDIMYNEMSVALKELVPSGWKPPGSEAEKPIEPPPPENKPGAGEGKEPGQIETMKPPEPIEPTAPVVVPTPPETEPPAAPQAGILLAVSEKGAVVSIDGKVVGKSPLEVLPDVDAGKHSIEVEKEGCKNYSGTLDVPASGNEGIIRQDIFLESKDKGKKSKSIAKQWWLWTIIGVVLAGGGAATAAILLQKDEPDAIPFPGY